MDSESALPEGEVEFISIDSTFDGDGFELFLREIRRTSLRNDGEAAVFLALDPDLKFPLIFLRRDVFFRFVEALDVGMEIFCRELIYSPWT